MVLHPQKWPEEIEGLTEESQFLGALTKTGLPHDLTLKEYVRLTDISNQRLGLRYEGKVTIDSAEMAGVDALFHLTQECRLRLIEGLSKNNFPIPSTNDVSFLINAIPHQDSQKKFSIKDRYVDYALYPFSELQVLDLVGLSVKSAIANQLKSSSLDFSAWTTENIAGEIIQGAELRYGPALFHHMRWLEFYANNSVNPLRQHLRIMIEEARFLIGDSTLAQATDFHSTFETGSKLYNEIRERDGVRPEAALDQMPIHPILRKFSRKFKEAMRLIEELKNFFKNGHFEFEHVGDKKIALKEAENALDCDEKFD